MRSTNALCDTYSVTGGDPSCVCADVPQSPLDLDLGELLRCVEPLLRCNLGAAPSELTGPGGMPLTEKVCMDARPSNELLMASGNFQKSESIFWHAMYLKRPSAAT